MTRARTESIDRVSWLKEFVERILEEREKAAKAAWDLLADKLKWLNDLRGNVLTHTEFTAYQKEVDLRFKAIDKEVNGLSGMMKVLLLLAGIAGGIVGSLIMKLIG